MGAYINLKKQLEKPKPRFFFIENNDLWDPI